MATVANGVSVQALLDAQVASALQADRPRYGPSPGPVGELISGGRWSAAFVAARSKATVRHARRFAMSMRAAYRHTRHDVRTGERPAALLRDPRQWQATRPAPRWPDDHRPQFRAVARTPCGGQAGDRGRTPGPRAHRRHRPPDDNRGAGR